MFVKQPNYRLLVFIIITVSLFGQLDACLQVVAKGMVERAQGGSIVNISSVGGMKAVPNHTIYCSAKGAMDQLTRTMALELGPHKVSCTRDK